MITPAYSMTATERVLPRLALDFTTGVLDPRVTVTRALNTATAVNSSGFIAVVNADLPRFDYDPVTQAARGLLIEEARTNFVLQSNTLTSNSDATVTANAATSPDGTTNAYRITKANATDPVYSSKSTSMTVAANTAYTVSRFVKYDGYNTTVSLEYNNTNNWGGTAWYAFFSVTSTGVTVSLVNSCTAAVQNFGNGWYRLTATFTTGGTITTPTNPSVLLRITGGSGVTVLGYGVQLEAGAFATSHIPTTTTSVTRNADVVSMTGTNFSSWYNASEGAFALELDTNIPGSGSQTPVSINDGSTNNYLAPYLLNVNRQFYYKVVASGSTQAEFTAASAVTNNAVFKYCFGYKLNNFQIAVNAIAATPDTTGNVPTVTQIQIGNQFAASYMNGHIRKLSYWPQSLISNEIQAFSK